MDHIKRNRLLYILGFGLAIIYFVTRIINIASLPIFTDEAIYIRWAQIALHDSSWRFISLTDGKGPFFIWVMIPFLKFIHDPLLAGRMVSVVSGFFTMIGIWALTRELFRDKGTAFLAVILYLFYPFAVVYDRMALYDSMVAAFAVWALYFSILLVRKIRLDIAYTLGALVGAGILTKANASFSEILLPFTLLLFDFTGKRPVRRVIKWLMLALLVIFIAQVIYSVQRLSPLYGVIDVKTSTFVYPVGEWVYHPLTFFIGNFKGLTLWLYQYLTIFYILLIIVGLFFSRFSKEKLLLFIYFGVPFIVLALFGKVIFPRFILFMSLMLLPVAALGLGAIITVFERIIPIGKSNSYASLAMKTVIITCFVLYSAVISWQFIFTPQIAQIAGADRGQYIAEWPAGWGVKESIAYFKDAARNQKIFIATEGTFGLMPEAYEMYFYDNPRITIKGIWPIKNIIPPDLVQKARQMPTYVVFYEPCPDCAAVGSAPPLWSVKQVFSAGQLNTHLTVYQVMLR